MLCINILLIAIWPPLRMPHLLHITAAILSTIFLQVYISISSFCFNRACHSTRPEIEQVLTSV